MRIGARSLRVIIMFCAALALALVFWWQWNRSPERRLQRFYSDDGEGVAEDMLMDPLILAGDAVVPLVIREVENPNMPRRRYALGFLGNGTYAEALPVLKRILTDQREVDYFRGDALKAIYAIDRNLADQYARAFSKRKDYLGDIARDVLSRDPHLSYRRSYVDALAGTHE